jgi:hypothetical protein
MRSLRDTFSMDIGEATGSSLASVVSDFQAFGLC